MKQTLRTILAVFVAVTMVAFAGCGKDDTNSSTGNKRYTLTVQSNNTYWGTATGGGTYADGTRVDIEAVASTGYYFIKWSDGAVSNPRTVTVSCDMILYALFSSNPNDPAPYNPGSNPTPGPDPQSGWVDLGLPSGLLWAECNVGATAPEDCGDYFAWGETQPKSDYSWSTYKYCNGSDNQLTKYCNDASCGYNGFTDNLTMLQPVDDAATVNMGNGARTPTMDEWNELLNNTTVEWTTLNDVLGRKFTAPNGESIFLPAAGHYNDSDFLDIGSSGRYWSSSLRADAGGAWRFYLNSDYQRMEGASRCHGQSVRAVRDR